MLIETNFGRVALGECDHLGHMNVQFYVSKVSDAAWHVMASIGITPAFIHLEDFHAPDVAGTGVGTP